MFSRSRQANRPPLVARALALPLCLLLSGCGGEGTSVAGIPPPPVTPTPTPTPSFAAGTVSYVYASIDPVDVKRTWLNSPAARLGNYGLIGRLTLFPAASGGSTSYRQVAPGEFGMSVTSSNNGGLNYTLNAPAGILPAGLTTSTVGIARISWDINSTVAYRYPNTYGDTQQYFGERLAGFAKAPNGTETQLFSYDYTRGSGGFGQPLDATTSARTVLDYDMGNSYVAMGEWSWGTVNNVTGNLVPGTGYGELLFVNGDRTPASDIPVSGTATYDARTLLGWVKVPFALSADFGQRSISASIDQDYRYDPAGDSMDNPLAFGIQVGGSAPFSNDGIFNIPLSGTVNWDHSYPGNTVQPPPAEAAAGSMNGAFFGPHAEQIGGTLWLSGTSGNQLFQDAFVGHQHQP